MSSKKEICKEYKEQLDNIINNTRFHSNILEYCEEHNCHYIDEYSLIILEENNKLTKKIDKLISKHCN